MTLYFYRDPQTAAWVSKHYHIAIMIRPEGSEYWSLYTCEPECYVLGKCVMESQIELEWRENIKYYIHHFSVCMIESLPEAECAALKLLGMWPESESV